MSFTGDLEHLPIVDVIQLLHSTRKTGTLWVRGGRGECQLVFNEGYITSANHPNTRVRIGGILVDMRVISRQDCDAALAGQQEAGAVRKPLIATLIEQGRLKQEDAYRGLRTLIEMTVVEMLRWTRGTFTLDVNVAVVSDEYRYFPEILHQEIHLDTQRVLMDALRIFDEKTRDGEFADEDENDFETDLAGTMDADAAPSPADGLSADDLGLGDIDLLERRIPEVFASIEVVDPAAPHRRAVADLWPEADDRAREQLVGFLAGCSDVADGGGDATARALIFFSRDRLARYVVMILGKALGALTFTSDDGQDLEMILAQSLRKKIVPLMVFDRPDEAVAGWTAADLTRLRRDMKGVCAQVAFLQLAGAEQTEFCLECYREGVRAVLPRPPAPSAGDGLPELLRFHEVLLACLRACLTEEKPVFSADFKDDLLALQRLRDASEVSRMLLTRLAESLERALTLIVRPGELLAEKGIGIARDKRQGPTPVEHLAIPIAAPGLLRQVLETGQAYYGAGDDQPLREQLFAKIGAPRSATVLLLPIASHGRVLAILYGDFGAGAPTAVPLDLLEILAGQAGLVLENAIYRRRLEKGGGP